MNQKDFHEPKRFSIDVDVVTKAERKKVEKALDHVIEKSIFKRWELDTKRSYKGTIPKAHYELYFDSQIADVERNLIFDVLYEEHGYAQTQIISIQSLLVVSDGEERTVETPTIDAITGDKLTAFAPTTIGVPYGSRKEMEIIKQLFDIGRLFDYIRDFKVLRDSFMAIAEKEMKYKNPDLLLDHVIQDIIDTSFLIGVRGRMDGKEKEYAEITQGIRGFDSFLFNEIYRIDQAILSSAKAAYLAALIKSNGNKPKFYNDGIDLKNYLFESSPHNRLNPLRKLPGGALYYWNETMKLL